MEHGKIGVIWCRAQKKETKIQCLESVVITSQYCGKSKKTRWVIGRNWQRSSAQVWLVGHDNYLPFRPHPVARELSSRWWTNDSAQDETSKSSQRLYVGSPTATAAPSVTSGNRTEGNQETGDGSLTASMSTRARSSCIRSIPTVILWTVGCKLDKLGEIAIGHLR